MTTIEEIKNKIINEYGEEYLNDVMIDIEGSQGITPNSVYIDLDTYDTIDQLITDIYLFIDENAYDCLEDYLDDCDGDEDEAMIEAVADSGNTYITIGSQKGCLGGTIIIAEFDGDLSLYDGH